MIKNLQINIMRNIKRNKKDFMYEIILNKKD